MCIGYTQDMYWICTECVRYMHWACFNCTGFLKRGASGRQHASGHHRQCSAQLNSGLLIGVRQQASPPNRLTTQLTPDKASRGCPPAHLIPVAVHREPVAQVCCLLARDEFEQLWPNLQRMDGVEHAGQLVSNSEHDGAACSDEDTRADCGSGHAGSLQGEYIGSVLKRPRW